MDPIGMEVFLCQFYRLEPKRHKEVAVTNSWAGLHNVSKFTQVRLVTCTCGRCLRSGIDTHSWHPSTSLQSINQRIQRTSGLAAIPPPKLVKSQTTLTCRGRTFYSYLLLLNVWKLVWPLTSRVLSHFM